jgi:hypothetical protein
VDNDTIAYFYEWYVDSGLGFELRPEFTTHTTEFTASIPSAYTSKHETWRCIVTPNDGTVNGSGNQAQVVILNSEPVALINSPGNGSIFDIGDITYFNGSNSHDPDNDELTYEWDFDYDLVNFSVDDSTFNVSKRWVDYFEGYVALRVKDDDSAWDITTTYVKVRNLPPQVKLQVLPTNVNVSVRMAGEKWHDIIIRLFEDNEVIVNSTIVRYPGSPNDQMFHITNITFNITREYFVTINYTPDDDPVNGQENGANPCWVILNFSNGNVERLHHTFNVMHPETYNWSVDLTTPFLSSGLNFTAFAMDPGPDELTFYWEFGDGTNLTKFYPNENLTFPFEVIQTTSHTYTSKGTFTISLIVSDNHGGKAKVSITINIS